MIYMPNNSKDLLKAGGVLEKIHSSFLAGFRKIPRSPGLYTYV